MGAVLWCYTCRMCSRLLLAVFPPLMFAASMAGAGDTALIPGAGPRSSAGLSKCDGIREPANLGTQDHGPVCFPH
jgi:hypothetical protein